MYVLYAMLVTLFPICHFERSPLKASTLENTAPHINKEKSSTRTRLGLEKKEERTMFKNRISAVPQKEAGKRNS